MKQMQWLFGVTNMPGGQNLVVGGANPLHIDYGPFGGAVQSPYEFHPDHPGYLVPAGHVLGLTSVTLESKFGWWGNYELPTMKLEMPVASYALTPNGNGFVQTPSAGTHIATLRPVHSSEDPNIPNAKPSGVAASSYLVLPGICTIQDTEPSRRFSPPLLIPAGARLAFVISNNHGAQSMNIVVQALLEPLNGRAADEVFMELL